MTVAWTSNEAALLEFVVDWQLSLAPEDSGTGEVPAEPGRTTIDLAALEAAARAR